MRTKIQKTIIRSALGATGNRASPPSQFILSLHRPPPAALRSSLFSSLATRNPSRLGLERTWPRNGLNHRQTRAYSLWPFGGSSVPPPVEPTPLVSEPPPPPPPAAPIVEVPLVEVTEAATTTTGSACQELAGLELEHGFLARYTSGAIEQGLCAVHDQLGLPWYLTIPTVIVCLRTVLVPINIWSMQIGARNMRVKPSIDIKIANIRALQTRGEQHKALAAQQELRAHMKEEGFRPLAPLGLPLVQGSLFVSFFWALREMGTHQLPSLTAEGALWFSDLTLAGPWYGLPLIASGLTLLSVETAAEMGGLKAGQSEKVVWFLRAVIVGTLWLFHDLPSAVFLYWCTNNLFSLLWGTFVRLTPRSVKEFLRIPDTSNVGVTKDESEKKVDRSSSFMDGFKAVTFGGGQDQDSKTGSVNGIGGVGLDRQKAPEPVLWKPISKKTNNNHPQKS